MFEKNNKSFFGFTLTELLIALTIIGAIAGLVIPSLMEGLQKKMLVTKLKSDIASIQQLANSQLVYYKTKDLLDTDFNDPAKLLVEKNFPIVRKCSTAAACWTTDSNGNTITYKRLSDSSSANGRITGENANTGKSVILKNGTILTYTANTNGASNLTTNYPEMKNSNGDKVIGMFRLDVNGADKPNFVGRDVFWFLITKKGKIVDYYKATNGTYNEETAIEQCKSAATITACASVVMMNNWTMPY